jgi:hypothetical protein
MLRLILGFAILATAGCSTSTGTPTAYVRGSVAHAIVLADRLSRIGSPDICNKGRRYILRHNGGTFYASCAGWKATVNYPPPASAHRFYLEVKSSVTNNYGAPPPPKGTALYYIKTADVTPQFGLTFDSTGITNAISSQQLSSSYTYTLYVYNFEFDNQCSSSPCPPWVADLGSPQGGTHSITFPSPLNGASFGNAPVVWQFVQN